MLRKVLQCVLLLWCCSHATVEVHNGFTFGPVFNWNIGSESHFNSVGFNAYYWEFRDGMPWSLGIGAEHGTDGQTLLFAEGQTGQVLLGASSGLVWSDKSGFGFQGSLWGNVFLGANIRYRYLGGNMFSPGVYLSIPHVKTSGNFE